MTRSQILAHIEKPVNYTLFDVQWIPSSARLIAMGSHPRGTGIWQVYQMSKGELKLLEEINTPSAIKCGTISGITRDARQLATGDFNGNLSLWDLENPTQPLYSVNAHSSIINGIDGAGGANVGKGAAELVTCGRDGCIKVWDLRQKDSPVAVIEAEQGQNRQDCWTVTFGGANSQTERLISAGFENGDVKIFDLKTMKVQWETNVGNGVCSVEFDRKDIEKNKLTVCTLESRLFVFDLTTQHPTKGFAVTRQKAHKSTVWAGRHLPQNRDIFMTCGGNGSLCLWKYEYPSKRFVQGSDDLFEGVAGSLQLVEETGVSSQPITAFRWSVDHLGLGACTSFDQTLRVLAVTGLNCI